MKGETVYEFTNCRAVADPHSKTVDFWFIETQVRRAWLEIKADEIDAMIKLLKKAKKQFSEPS